MPKMPFMTTRKGSKNQYYKRPVPKELHREDRPKQIWKSLGTSDPASAKVAYRLIDEEIDQLFEGWRQSDAAPDTAPSASAAAASPTNLVVPLTPSLAKVACDRYFLFVVRTDFDERSKRWAAAKANPEAFWRGDVIGKSYFPPMSWQNALRKDVEERHRARFEANPKNLTDVFLAALANVRAYRLTGYEHGYRLGRVEDMFDDVDFVLSTMGKRLDDFDRRGLARHFLITRIKALKHIIAEDTSGSEQAVSALASAEQVAPATIQARPAATTTTATAAMKFSDAIEAYVAEVGREKEWPVKSIDRKRGELREFLGIIGDKSLSQYTHEDGVTFKDAQNKLPANRLKPPFKGLSLLAVIRKAEELRGRGEQVEHLSPTTINDKLFAIGGLFRWARRRDKTLIDPVEGLKAPPRNKRLRKRRQPWSLDELNVMFAAPIYTGCRSTRFWSEKGHLIARDSGMFWIPLIALFSGLRLGEIVQLQLADVKTLASVQYFDVTPDMSPHDGEDEDDDKSVKTGTSKRGVPVHKTLIELGLNDFISRRRAAGGTRLFEDFKRDPNDESWSKSFSKYFTRFRRSVEVTRKGVKFHSFRHNVEDALRNANVRKDVRDAVQGHGENGVSAEYGTGYYIETLNEAVQQIRYDDLKLDHLLKRPALLAAADATLRAGILAS